MAKGIKVKLALSKEQAALVEKIVAAKLKLVGDNIAAVVRKEAIPHLIDLIMKHYDKLGERMEGLPHDDPTNPIHWRGTFKDKLEEEAEQTFIFDRTSGIIKLNLGEKSFLGYGGNPDTDSNTPLVWMVYYLEGLAGSWGWITRDVWEQVFPDGNWDTTWGRFKSAPGFMISGGDFFARKTKNDKPNLFRQKVTWSEVRHPFSAFSPLDIFAEALNEFNIRPFVDKAIKAAMSGRKL
ncbi:hypothetical protein LCGC14_1932860 [marine sediment metagenome]|uniref:Uncharacterized protein n=1 Tax=marine sediment metagenome TaxID=412755 RepID=A0A0F9IK42_9ZZZZ